MVSQFAKQGHEYNDKQTQRSEVNKNQAILTSMPKKPSMNNVFEESNIQIKSIVSRHYLV